MISVAVVAIIVAVVLVVRKRRGTKNTPMPLHDPVGTAAEGAVELATQPADTTSPTSILPQLAVTEQTASPSQRQLPLASAPDLEMQPGTQLVQNACFVSRVMRRRTVRSHTVP